MFLIVRALTAVSCVVVFSHCAHVESAGTQMPAFSSLRGKPVAVELIDHTGLFTSSADVVDQAKQGIERQLIGQAMAVAEGSEQRITFEAKTVDGDQASKPCISVTARFANAAKLGLPTEEVGFQRCTGQGVRSKQGEDFGNGIFAVVTGSKSLADETRPTRGAAKMLSEALGEVLARLNRAQATPAP